VEELPRIFEFPPVLQIKDWGFIGGVDTTGRFGFDLTNFHIVGDLHDTPCAFPLVLYNSSSYIIL
jgi:hypothetical protein